MKITQLKILRALTENRFNITKAADKLNMAQSAASRQLMLLERELKIDLFIRNGKRFVDLSNAGKTVDQYAKRLLLEENNIHQIALSAKNKSEKELSLATTHTQARYFLPAVISRLNKFYPDLQYQIIQSSPNRVAELLDSHKVQFAICTEVLGNHKEFVTFNCYRWKHVALVPVSHPLAQQKSIKIKTLAEYNLITYIHGYTGRTELDAAFEKNHCQMRVILAATDSDVIKTYVRLKMGVGILNQIAYSVETDRDLVALPISDLHVECLAKLAVKKSLYLPTFYENVIKNIQEEGRRFERIMGRKTP